MKTADIMVKNVGYEDILKQKRVLEKIVFEKPITVGERNELEGTLYLLDFLQDNHPEDKK